MKMNKKLLVSAMSVAMAAGVVGSISGTVAWYQYSTKATMSLMATSIGCDQNLKIAVGGDTAPALNSANWKNEITSTDITAATSNDLTKFAPVTTGAQAKDASLATTLYNNPIYGVASMANWKAATKNDEYVQFNLWIVATEKNNGDTDPVPVNKAIGLSDVTIEKQSTATKDISDAVRVHLDWGNTAAKKVLIANPTDGTLNTNGKLDLNGDGANDKELGYEWEASGSEITYGAGTQTWYQPSEVVGTEDAKTDAFTAASVDFGTTGTAAFKVVVTVWLEGWQKLPSEAANAMWSAKDYAGEKFQLGLTFASGKVSA